MSAAATNREKQNLVMDLLPRTRASVSYTHLVTEKVQLEQKACTAWRRVASKS